MSSPVSPTTACAPRSRGWSSAASSFCSQRPETTACARATTDVRRRVDRAPSVTPLLPRRAGSGVPSRLVPALLGAPSRVAEACGMTAFSVVFHRVGRGHLRWASRLFLNRRSQVRFLPGALSFRSLFARFGVDRRGPPGTGLDPRFGKLLASSGAVESPDQRCGGRSPRPSGWAIDSKEGRRKADQSRPLRPRSG